MRRASKLLPVLFLIMNLAIACSTQKTVTTRYLQYDPRTGEPVTIEKETTTTTENSGAGAAVLSGAMSLIGTVILLPVRAVGILIDAIL
jgi:type IV pilus biogenesis protein CpaD/CtpE